MQLSCAHGYGRVFRRERASARFFPSFLEALLCTGPTENTSRLTPTPPGGQCAKVRFHFHLGKPNGKDYLPVQRVALAAASSQAVKDMHGHGACLQRASNARHDTAPNRYT